MINSLSLPYFLTLMSQPWPERFREGDAGLRLKLNGFLPPAPTPESKKQESAQSWKTAENQPGLGKSGLFAAFFVPMKGGCAKNLQFFLKKALTLLETVIQNARHHNSVANPSQRLPLRYQRSPMVGNHSKIAARQRKLIAVQVKT
jgi:hypothetical protein